MISFSCSYSSTCTCTYQKPSVGLVQLPCLKGFSSSGAISFLANRFRPWVKVWAKVSLSTSLTSTGPSPVSARCKHGASKRVGIGSGSKTSQISDQAADPLLEHLPADLGHVTA